MAKKNQLLLLWLSFAGFVVMALAFLFGSEVNQNLNVIGFIAMTLNLVLNLFSYYGFKK